MRIKRKIELDSQPFDDIIFFLRLMDLRADKPPFARGSAQRAIMSGGDYRFASRRAAPFRRGSVPRAVASELLDKSPLATARGADHRQAAPFRRVGKGALIASYAGARSVSSLLDLFIGSITKRCENCAPVNEFPHAQRCCRLSQGSATCQWRSEIVRNEGAIDVLIIQGAVCEDTQTNVAHVCGQVVSARAL